MPKLYINFLPLSEVLHSKLKLLYFNTFGVWIILTLKFYTVIVLFLSVKRWESLPIYKAKEIWKEMCCGYLFILICWRLCTSYMTLGNTGILGHVCKSRLHCSSRKIIKPPCLFLTRVLKIEEKKKKACQYFQMLSSFKIINSVFLTTVE